MAVSSLERRARDCWVSQGAINSRCAGGGGQRTRHLSPLSLGGFYQAICLSSRQKKKKEQEFFEETKKSCLGMVHSNAINEADC